MLWEVETQPTGLFHTASDWGDLLITRQLVEPLFREAPERTLTSDLVDRCHRTGALTWRLSVADGFCWSDGKQVLARDIGRQLALVSRAGGPTATCTALLASAHADSATSLTVTTRLAVGDIRAWLTCPALGPADIRHGHVTGKYTLSARHDDWLELTGVADDGAVRSVTARNDRPDSTSPGNLTPDVSSLLGGLLPSTHAQPVCAGPGGSAATSLSTADLDILVGIELPSDLDGADVDMVNGALERSGVVGAAPELLCGRSSATEVWSAAANRPGGGREPSDRLRRTRWVLRYTPFPPNERIAKAVVDQLRSELGLSIRALGMPYRDLVDRRRPLCGDELHLVLAAPVAAHPAAQLTDVYLRFSRAARRPSSPEQAFLQLFEGAVAAGSPEDAARFAAAAESAIPEHRVLWLASLRAAMRHVGPTVWIPPSGLIDIRPIHRGWPEFGRLP